MVLAARLTEDPNVTVAVLEAGGNGLDDLLIDAPNLFQQLWGKPEYDWDFRTVPQVCAFVTDKTGFVLIRSYREEPSVKLMAGLVAKSWVEAVQ